MKFELPEGQKSGKLGGERRLARVEIGSLTKKFEGNFIRDITKDSVEASARREGISVREYLKKYYFSVKYGGREYLLVLSKSSGDAEERPIEFAEQKEGTVIYVDESVPRKFWEVILAHEITEIDEYGKGFRPELAAVTPEEDQKEKERAHRAAIVKEQEYAKLTLDPKDYEEYERWQKELREKYAGY